MRRTLRGLLIVAFIVVAFGSRLDAATVSPLFERGYDVIPVPQQVTLKDNDFEFSNGWRLALGLGVNETDVAVESLNEGMAKRYGVTVAAGGQAPGS